MLGRAYSSVVPVIPGCVRSLGLGLASASRKQVRETVN